MKYFLRKNLTVSSKRRRDMFSRGNLSRATRSKRVKISSFNPHNLLKAVCKACNSKVSNYFTGEGVSV